MNENEILLAGPWVGEFGHELFCWQGFVRRLSEFFNKTIIIGRVGHKYLYEDFCSEYIEFNPMSYKTDAWRCFDARSYESIPKNIPHSFYLDGQCDIGMRYGKNGVTDLEGLFFNEQKFVKYEYKNNNRFDLIFHCRNKSTDSFRNWSKENWEVLRALLPNNLKIACIGNNEAFHINNTIDLRDIEIKELVGTINNSKLIIGQSSGPMHLASLCGKKHLVWSPKYNRIRYEKDWNPFNTDVVFYDKGGWYPDPTEISKIIQNNI